MKLEPMDPAHPERRRMVYVPMRPGPNWVNHLVDTLQLVSLSAVLLGGLYILWEVTR